MNAPLLSTPAASHFPPAGGQMGALIRQFDWASTRLGPIDTWSEILRGAVSLMLPAQAQIVMFWGPDFIAIYNDAYAPSIGNKHPRALGRPARENWSELWDDLEPLLRGVRDTGKTFSAKDRPFVIERQGFAETVTFDVSFSAACNEADDVEGVVCIVSETTQRVMTEKRLREREAELARVQAIGKVGGLEVDLRHGFTNRRSPEYLTLHGLPPEAATETHEDWVRRIHPDDRDATDKQFRDAVKGNITDYHSEYRIIRPSDGRTRWIEVTANIERDAGGKALRLVGAHIDITARKRAEDALRRLNENLEQQVADRTRERDRMWNVSQDLLVVADSQGHWLSANPAWTKLLGWHTTDFIGRTSEWLEHPDDRERTVEATKRIFTKARVIGFENRLRHKDGSYRWLSWTAALDKGLIYAAGRDITAEKEAAEKLRATEEQLRQAQKMEAIGQLTGGIAHDFNNLLTGIMGSLDLMRRRIAAGRAGEVDRFIDAAVASANRAAGLTQRLLAFSRRQSLDLKAVDINRLMISLDDLLQRTMGEQIKVTTTLAANLWVAEGDPNQIETSLLNLAINARDAMPDGGTLTIETANRPLADSDKEGLVAGDYIVLRVTDTGTGMSQEVIARAFDPFFTTKPLGQGTGLGLSMVYGYAKQARGHVSIDSEIGRGTSITLYLPRHRGEVAREAEKPAADAARAHDGQTVLVVEDDPGVRLTVVEVLDELGYHALEAVDGKSALPILQSRQRIDLLITDVGLPGLNGRQVADAARQSRPDLKVLFITGYAENAFIRSGFLDPGMELITKPFTVDSLASKIAEMIESQQSARKGRQ